MKEYEGPAEHWYEPNYDNMTCECDHCAYCHVVNQHDWTEEKYVKDKWLCMDCVEEFEQAYKASMVAGQCLAHNFKHSCVICRGLENKKNKTKGLQ